MEDSVAYHEQQIVKLCSLLGETSPSDPAYESISKELQTQINARKYDINKLRGLNKATQFSSSIVYSVVGRSILGRVAGKIATITSRLFTPTPSAKGLIGREFENFLTNQLGGNGSFKVNGREFDGGFNNIWWEAKSGEYWDLVLPDAKEMSNFYSSIGERLSIAKKSGATFELYSNTPIPQAIKDWLTKKGITFEEYK